MTAPRSLLGPITKGRLATRTRNNLRIREAMFSKGFGYRTLAKRTGYTAATLRNVVTGTSESKAIRIAIEKALRLSIWNAANDAAPIPPQSKPRPLRRAQRLTATS